MRVINSNGFSPMRRRPANVSRDGNRSNRYDTRLRYVRAFHGFYYNTWCVGLMKT